LAYDVITIQVVNADAMNGEDEQDENDAEENENPRKKRKQVCMRQNLLF
jgi:hypothetical protein